MSLVEMALHFELDDIGCSRELLGSSITVERETIRFRIDFPEEPDAFTFAQAVPAEAEEDERSYAPRRAFVGREEADYVLLRLVRVVANTESSLSMSSYQPEDAHLAAEEERLRTEMVMEARKLVIDFCNWVRVRMRQDWMEPTGMFPRLVGDARLIDLDKDTPFPTMVIQAGSLLVIDPSSILEQVDVNSIEKALGDPGSPPVDELLLSEARHLLWSNLGTAPDRAILLAAIATEVRVKRSLRTLASRDRTELVDLLLDHPREWSMAAHSLFAKAVTVVARVEVTPEHREVAKRLQRLFEDRNQIVHRGASFDKSIATGDVLAAEDARRQLERLEASIGER